MRCLDLVIVTAMLSHGAAFAAEGGPDKTFFVKKNEAGKLECKPKPSAASLPTGDKVLVDVDVSGAGSAATDWTLTANGVSKGFEHATSGNITTLTVHKSDVGSDPVQVAVSFGGALVLCPSARLFKVQLGVDDATHTDVDAKAQAWWIKHGQEETDNLLTNGHSRGLPYFTRLLVHLPSGKVAYPSPSGITEGKDYQVAFILPVDEAGLPGVNVTQCDDVDPFRTNLTEDKNKEQNADLVKRAMAESRFKLVPVGSWFSCGAGHLKYDVTPIEAYAPAVAAGDGGKQAGAVGKDPAGDAAKAAVATGAVDIKVHPRYHLAAVAMVGWDSAKTLKYEKQRDPSAADPATASQLVGAVDGRIGATWYVGATWMIGGVDYQDMRAYNYFANLFVGVNPSSPLDDVVVGLALTPVGSLSVTGGLSLHSGTRLKSGYKANDKFTGDGDIPVERSWSTYSAGFFVGASIDSNIWSALVAKFKK